MEKELYHYGVLGMKWGIRRYQNADGSLTAEGRKRARKEYREDNRKAFEYGKNATITEKALSIASKKEERAANRFEKHPNVRTHDKFRVAHAIREYLDIQKRDWDSKISAHYDELISKYGKEAVSNISRDKKGRINESVHTVGDYALSAFITAASGVAIAMGSPVGVISVPKGKNEMGRDLYKSTKKFEKKRFNQARKSGEFYE